MSSLSGFGWSGFGWPGFGVPGVRSELRMVGMGEGEAGEDAEDAEDAPGEETILLFTEREIL